MFTSRTNGFERLDARHDTGPGTESVKIENSRQIETLPSEKANPAGLRFVGITRFAQGVLRHSRFSVIMGSWNSGQGLL
jgi:hypothetical protein